MIAATTLRDMWEGIVTSHYDGLAFYSLWSAVKDEDHDATYPRALWKDPQQSGVRQGRNNILDAYTLTIWFEDQTTTERTTGERDAAHSDMSLVARMCLNRFLDLYCRTITTFGGYQIDLRLEGTYDLTPYWDTPGTSCTGVRLTFTVVDQIPTCVTDEDFPLS